MKTTVTIKKEAAYWVARTPEGWVVASRPTATDPKAQYLRHHVRQLGYEPADATPTTGVEIPETAESLGTR